MTLNYFIQHNFFKNMILTKIDEAAIKKAIEDENADFFTGLIMKTVKFFGDKCPEERDMMQYETTFISVGDNKAARCRFTGNLSLVPPDCSSIIIAVTDQIYYITLETKFGGRFMLCRWDGESHMNYGPIESDDPKLYAEKIKGIINA